MDSSTASKPKSVKLTLASGCPIGDKFNSLTIGPRGPLLLQDVAYLEETAVFNRERIPERVVHARGMSAYGNFKVTESTMSKYCKAKVFATKGKKTDVVVRFSMVTGEMGSADTVRDVRGFAVRFYTDEGNLDIVGNNSPVFFIRDPIQFTSFIHSQKRHPKTHMKDPDAFWDFIALNPESLHQVCILFGDRGIPDGFRHMHGFGVNTYKLVNDSGQVYFAKFHWRCQQKIKNLETQEAVKLAGKEPDYALKDLQTAIKKKDYPAWKLFVQVVESKQIEHMKFNPFDDTKVWPHKQYPMMEVGKLTLDRLPQDYFAEVEQLAFCPANLVPGVEPSPDKMLLGRMFSYQDAQRYRIGGNYYQLPVNKPHCPVMTPTYRDGKLVHKIIEASVLNYVPNNKLLKGQLMADKSKHESDERYSGQVARYDGSDDDNFSQARELWLKVLSKDQQARMIGNIADHLRLAQANIQEKMVKHFGQVHEDFGKGLEKALKKHK